MWKIFLRRSVPHAPDLTGFEFVPTRRQTESSNIFKFMQKHNIKSLEHLYSMSAKDPEWFWESVEQDVGVVWDVPYSDTLDLSAGMAWPKWFVGGKTNIYASSVQRVAHSDPDRVAYHFVSEDRRTSDVTYSQLDNRVCRLANALRSLGVGKGDVVAIYMPMNEQAITAILASAKIGAIQTTIFSGYGPDALSVRLRDCNAKVLFVTDGFYRKGKSVSQKGIVRHVIKEWASQDTDRASGGHGVCDDDDHDDHDGDHDTCRDPTQRKVIMVPYGGIDRYPEADDSSNVHDVMVCYDKLVSAHDGAQCTTTMMDSEDPLFILYTSGTTGRPKGTIHTHGGFSVFAGHQSKYLIDMQKDDILFWPADIGWITGLVWNVYGLLMMGASAVMYDGSLDQPDMNRVWRILSEYHVTIFGISPTAVRMLHKSGAVPTAEHDLSCLKNIPTTGEPLDRDSWMWLFKEVGHSLIPIMNLAGGTEIGGAMLSVLPGMKLKPSTVGRPVPGMVLDIVDDDGSPVADNTMGYLVVKAPWPAMSRGLLNNDAVYLRTYWSRFDGVWFHGDYVLRDEDGLWYMRGRTDDVINVAGHRMSTTEIEHAAVRHEQVSDAAAVAIPDDLTGEAIVLFVVEDGTPKDVDYDLCDTQGNMHSNDDRAHTPSTATCDQRHDGVYDESHDVQNTSIPTTATTTATIQSDVCAHISHIVGKISRPKHVFVLSELPRTKTGKVMRRLLRSILLGQNPGDLSALEDHAILSEIPKLHDRA